YHMLEDLKLNSIAAGSEPETFDLPEV
ncbi:hypothetical protein CFC21_093530, partial [Triticum aestivum]